MEPFLPAGVPEFSLDASDSRTSAFVAEVEAVPTSCGTVIAGASLADALMFPWVALASLMPPSTQ